MALVEKLIYGVYISQLVAFGRECDEYADFSLRHRALVEKLIYGVYISRLVAFGRACDEYPDFSLRHRALVEKLIKQGYIKSRLKSKFFQFFEKYKNLISKYDKTCEFFVEDVYPQA